MLSVHVHSIVADGMNVFYREAGTAGHPVILLLHGGIASSFQFRALMPLLARDFHVIAPDLPGHGFTSQTQGRTKPYSYTFSSLAHTLIAFVDGLKLTSYALYMFDFGAAVGYRLALAHPERVTAIVAQGGNAYVEGLGKAWEPVKALWGDVKPSSATDKLELLRAALLTPSGVHWVYSHGSGTHGNGRHVAPESHIFESSLLLQEPARQDVHLALLADYKSTVELYPLFQRYLRDWSPRVLAIWGNGMRFWVWRARGCIGGMCRMRRLCCWMRGILCWRRMWRRWRLR
ncbi:alpha/beta hydrolase [Rhizoctonia solani AG-3 Rhs1AP]|uniref:Alpha/beta hydrolase n=1 Tax=Rhizoctonia solani AG-3 Rhs1AP TaxID=1086054 RepID=X8IXH1_9AGAM|nr:alpha/beta hydrolase [Rhizoctonia solani AG-3 Rhs1AP]